MSSSVAAAVTSVSAFDNDVPVIVTDPSDNVAIMVASAMVHVGPIVQGTATSQMVESFIMRSNATYGSPLSMFEQGLLRNVLTNVDGYDALVILEDTSIPFMPVLEARGGNDKDDHGHRRDTLPIAQAIAETRDCRTAIIQFLDETKHGMLAQETNWVIKKFLQLTANGIIVRVNPGTFCAASQKQCDDTLRELSDAGVQVLTHPDVMSTLGSKDSLVKIKNLKCGLEDTEVYLTPESLMVGFCKSIAFQPRVIKQNRGSQGEGIWIVKLRDESSYCNWYGERYVSLDTEIVLVEAYDNHTEYHTVGEFLEFCIHGRTKKSGHWFSTGFGRYFDGGLEAGSMIVDQRFLPRITEGEVRCLFVGTELVEILHKIPKEGGISATLASGAIYTKYAPDDKAFESLVRQLQDDVPRIMGSFDMSHRPLPLLWTADYIYGDSDDDLYVGEINCSCPGITQQLHITPVIAKVALEYVFGHR